MSQTAKVRTGACLCGRVKYRLEGEAATPLWNTICYCLNCRRRTGSAYYTASICSKNGFTITEGLNSLCNYKDTMTDSTKPLDRQWCSNCGSNLFNFTALADHIVSISAGSLDDFEEWMPTLEQYCIHRADFLDAVKSVEKRYHESINGQYEQVDKQSSERDGTSTETAL